MFAFGSEAFASAYPTGAPPAALSKNDPALGMRVTLSPECESLASDGLTVRFRPNRMGQYAWEGPFVGSAEFKPGEAEDEARVSITPGFNRLRGLMETSLPDVYLSVNAETHGTNRQFGSSGIVPIRSMAFAYAKDPNMRLDEWLSRGHLTILHCKPNPNLTGGFEFEATYDDHIGG